MSKRKTNTIDKAIVRPMGQVPKEKLSSKVKFGSSLEEVNVRNISLDGGEDGNHDIKRQGLLFFGLPLRQ